MKKIKQYGPIHPKINVLNKKGEDCSSYWGPDIFIQRWKYEKIPSSFSGIFVSNKEPFESILIHSRMFGIYLGTKPIATQVLEEKHYDNEAHLFKNVIIVHGQLKKDLKNYLNTKIKIDYSKMPKRILTMISEKEENISNISKSLELSLDEFVLGK